MASESKKACQHSKHFLKFTCKIRKLRKMESFLKNVVDVSMLCKTSS